MSFSVKKFPACLASLALVLLTACSGQSATDTATNGSSASPSSQTLSFTATGQTTPTKLLDSLAVLYPNGQLPAERTAQAAQDLSQNPAALKLTAETYTAYKSQSTTSTSVTAQATAADYQPVKRVQNTTLYGAYFFSIYPTEIATALATNPNWALEGPAFWASLATGTDLYPVHRFRNKTNGSYLYSIYETERADIAANYAATFAYEGVAWYARQTPATGWSALYRFRNKTNGTYLFSAYESEKNAIVSTYPDVFALEGIAYYVRQDAPIAKPPFVYKLPDTGVTSSQCIGVGGNAYISCTSAAAIALNPMQDGMRGLDVTEPAAEDGKLGFSYSEVPNSAGGSFARTECVKDNLTGLMWEGKTDAGLRSISNYYTNYDNTAAIQLQELQEINGGGFTYVSRAPTQAEVDAGSNTIGYVAAVNVISLCGFTDWRLPTEKELQSLTDYSGGSPAITVDWFPNTVTWDAYFATSIKYLNGSTGLNDFNVLCYRSNYGEIGGCNRGGGYTVRLVRGTKLANNFVISADEQEVTDTKTGLIWRRCAEGMTVVGGTCTGTAINFNNENALVRANAQRVATGVAWRLPNVKELNSIADNSRIAPAIDTTAFPATPLDYFNTATFYVQSGIVFNAWAVNFHVGHVVVPRRTDQIKVRLVR